MTARAKTAPPEKMNPITHVETYDPAHLPLLAVAEDRHFWFRARNQMIRWVLERDARNWPARCRVLEVGCGTGKVLPELQRSYPRGSVIGMELFAEGLRLSRRRHAGGLVQADLRDAPFNAVFHVIGLFDVLEHLPDDREALRKLRALLIPAGTLVITVPAHQWLWSSFDEEVHHVRRYSRADLENVLKDAGFDVEFMTEFMMATLPFVWLNRRVLPVLRWARGRRAAATVLNSELRIYPGLNGLLTWLLTQEAKVLRRTGWLPCGTSLLAVARRNSHEST